MRLRVAGATLVAMLVLAPSLMANGSTPIRREMPYVMKKPTTKANFRVRLANEMQRLHRLAGKSARIKKPNQLKPAPVSFRARAHRELKRLHYAVLIEKRRKAQEEGYVSPRMGAWLCIHRHEGAWNDHNAPNWGGLQMDYNFMSAYGSEFLRRWGTADNWPMWAQVKAADRAYESGRGFTPWPNTARACGLL